MERKHFNIDERDLTFAEIADFVFKRESYASVSLAPACSERVAASHRRFQSLLEKDLPIYGVTTGFGDSCFRSIGRENSETLQANLISYLLCGSGDTLPVEASRATFLIRFKSLSRGYSGVSLELIDRMKLYIERDWIPVVPREGSLGASGDLIPLAYLARILQGEGKIHTPTGVREIAEVLKEYNVPSYRLKAKEGLALVNGTSTMAGLYLCNLAAAKFLSDVTCLATSWLCLALKGRTEAFGVLVNEKTKFHPGQIRAARLIRANLAAEKYESKPLDKIEIKDSHTVDFVQDRYSLRCTPQVMGPVYETLDLIQTWFENEANGTSDNPLIDDDSSLGMGGNFYGGHLSHGMDYLKICVSHMADLIDRQLMTLIDEKSNRGLPANLVDWNSIPKEERFLHHGLKGLHQAVSAITSEILARSMPNGVFSRSSESHNQDKVSLGMSAAVQCSQMLEPMFTITAMYLTCLAQALDLRGVKLHGHDSLAMYDAIRTHVPFVKKDMPLGEQVGNLAASLKRAAGEQRKVFSDL